VGIVAVDFDVIYRANRSKNGDVKSICELIYYFSSIDEWDEVATYMELLVENDPEFCEQKFKEITGDDLTYERMLGLIGAAYFDDNNFLPAFRWFQKYLDYLEFKNAPSNMVKWQAEKQEMPVYNILKKAGQLNKSCNRFLLKWEQELLYKNQ